MNYIIVYVLMFKEVYLYVFGFLILLILIIFLVFYKIYCKDIYICEFSLFIKEKIIINN